MKFSWFVLAAAGFIATVSVGPAAAVAWTTDFTTNPSPVILAGNASYQTIYGSRCMRLTPNSPNQEGWFMVNQNCGGSGTLEWFDVRWTQCLDPITGTGKGLCFAFADLGTNPDFGVPTGNSGPNPGLKIVWHQGNDKIYVIVNGTKVIEKDFNPDTGAQFRICRVTWWRSTGRLRVNCYGGTTQIDQTITGLDPQLSWRFDWGADGASSNYGQMAIDDIEIYTGTSPGIPSTGLTYANTNPLTWSWAAPSDYGHTLQSYTVKISNGSEIIHTGSSTTPSFAYSVPSAGYWYSAQVKVASLAVNNQVIETRFTDWGPGTLFDNIAPTLSGPANPTSAYSTNGNITFTWPAATDSGGSGVKNYYLHIWRTDIPWGNPGSDVGPGQIGNVTSYNFTGGQNGITYRAWVYAIDNANNWGSHSWGSGCLVDTVAPSGSVVINSNAQYANTTAVTLTLSASDAHSGVAQMRFSNDNTNWSAWETYTTSKSWTLSSGDGSKTVYAQFKDNAGNVSASVSDGIILDTTPPTAGTTSSPAIKNTAPFTVSFSGASDTLSGLSQIILFYKKDAGAWTSGESLGYAIDNPGGSGSFSFNPPAGDGVYGFKLRAKDKAGNFSAIPSGSADSQTTYDTTPPSVPTGLTQTGATKTSISLSWTHSTDNLGLFGYKVFRNGVFVGTTSSNNYIDQDLTLSTTYSYSVSAIDNADNESAQCGAIQAATADMTIGEAKLFPDNDSVLLANKVVTAVVSGGFYMEEADRSAGIKVQSTASVNIGDVVRVEGSLVTETNKERAVNASSVIVTGASSVDAVMLTNKALGGADYNYDPITGAGQAGVYDGTGLNNIGLLVQTSGEVTGVGSDYFYINDGTNAADGSIFMGVRVVCPGLNKPSTGDYVTVKGISSIRPLGGKLFRIIKPRFQSDIAVN